MLWQGEKPLDEQDAFRENPLRLAYLGDTVWDVLTRTRLMFQGLNLHHMHELAVLAVNAHAQAEAFRRLADSLSEREAAMARRGRNAHPKHAAPRHQSPEDYQEATALETLFGYLYLCGQDARIRELYDLAVRKEENHA